MQKFIILGFLLLSISIFGQTELDPNKYYAETNTVFLKSTVFEKDRELQIFIPDQYFKNPEKKFKVIYLFDGQNQPIFNFISGNIQILASMNKLEPMIVVGIVTEDRWNEFLTPNNHQKTLDRYKLPMGNADLLIEHIQTEVEPYLKKNYRTEDYRIAIGQSLGATFATYASMKTENLFDYNILISPNYEYDQKQFVDRFKEFAKSELSKTKSFYFANGYGDEYEQKYNGPLKEAIEILKYSNNPKIKWDYKKLDIDSHGLTWFGVYNGLLNWE